MTTDPNALLNLARCFRCVPPGMQSELWVRALCSWAFTPVAPANAFNWAPQASLMRWSDATHPLTTSNFAFFQANADPLTVDVLQYTPVTQLTAVNNLYALPLLNTINFAGTAGPGTPLKITDLDLTNCTNLVSCAVTFSKLQTIELVNCPNLSVLSVHNSFLTDVNLLACSALTNVNVGANLLGTLHTSAAANPLINTLIVSGNVALVVQPFNLDAYTLLQTLLADNTGLGTIPILGTQPINNLLGNNNTMAPVDVSATLSALDANTLNNGTVNLALQTPSSPPTMSGIVALNNLLNKGWTATTDACVLDDGSGGHWAVIADINGNLGTIATVAPASGSVVIQDSALAFWELVVDVNGSLGAQASAGPATADVILSDDTGATNWKIVVDTSGNVGAVFVFIP